MMEVATVKSSVVKLWAEYFHCGVFVMNKGQRLLRHQDIDSQATPLFHANRHQNLLNEHKVSARLEMPTSPQSLSPEEL